MGNVSADNLIEAMSRPSFYDHPVDAVELIETHISWIFLAGDYAYKVKKPLDFGFLDFSTLAKRHFYCSEELRLNRRFAKNMYLDVKQIGGTTGYLALDKSPAQEYAVKMRRFPQTRQLDRMLETHQLRPRHISAFARRVAELHRSANRADENMTYGTPESVLAPMLENFRQIRPLLQEDEPLSRLRSLEHWTQTSFATLEPLIGERKRHGFVRECHGDLHLANMAWVDEHPLLFDCIEFNDNLRWIDTMNEVAFLIMDLDDRQERQLGWRFLNHYLQETGDDRGLSLLNFYKVYRAMVRAKVTCLRLAQDHVEEDERRRTKELFCSYLLLAESYTLPQAPILIITHGFSGSGKTTFAEKLAETLGAVHIRSDIERKRLHGLAAAARSGSPVDGGIYTEDASGETYSRLRDIAETALRSGFHAIVDATFIKRQHRDLFQQFAETIDAPLVIIDFPLPDAALRRRIEHRAHQEAVDASEATVEVLDYQLENAEPLTRLEKELVLTISPETRADQTIAALRKSMDIINLGKD